MVIQKKTFFTSAKKFIARMCCGKELSENQKRAIIAAKKLEHINTRIFEVIDCSRSSI